MSALDKLLVVLSSVMVTLFILVNILIRINHPELSEVELFGRYWRLYAVNVVPLMVTFACVKSDA